MSATEMSAADRKAIRETLAGYAAAAEVIEQERIEQLRRMTPQESWQIFTVLLERGRAFMGEHTSLEVFDAGRLGSPCVIASYWSRLPMAIRWIYRLACQVMKNRLSTGPLITSLLQGSQ